MSLVATTKKLSISFYQYIHDLISKANEIPSLANLIEPQSRDAVTRSERLLDLREQARQQLTKARAAARLLQVVDLLFAQPVLTVRRVEAALDVNFSTAQRYISQLEEVGLVRKITGQSRNRIYRADEVLRAIEEPLTVDGKAKA